MTNKWTWAPATGMDVVGIKDIAESMFQTEIEGIFQPDPIAYMRNITQAVVNQYYSPGSELILVAKTQQNDQIVAYLWVKRNQRAPWSDEEMAMVQMVHVDLSLGSKDRIRLVREMIAAWETWCENFGVKIVCSTTMRRDQSAFLRIHQQCGYDVRGSYCYKRLSTAQTGLPIP